MHNLHKLMPFRASVDREGYEGFRTAVRAQTTNDCVAAPRFSRRSATRKRAIHTPSAVEPTSGCLRCCELCPEHACFCGRRERGQEYFLALERGTLTDGAGIEFEGVSSEVRLNAQVIAGPEVGAECGGIHASSSSSSLPTVTCRLQPWRLRRDRNL